MAVENGGPSQKDVLGRSRIFTPEVVNDIHIKAELGRYRMRGFSIFKPIPHWDELVFLPGTLTRFVIEGYREKCDTTTVLGARFAKHPGSKGQEHHLRFVAEMVPIYQRFSRMPEFRRIPCLLASLHYWLALQKDTCYARSAELGRNGRRAKAFTWLFTARVLRRARLGMTRLAEFQRAHAKRRTG